MSSRYHKPDFGCPLRRRTELVIHLWKNMNLTDIITSVFQLKLYVVK